MESILYLFVLLLAAGVNSQVSLEIRDYKSLKKAVGAGLKLNFVSSYGECMIDGKPGPKATGGSTVPEIRLNGDGSVSFSATKLIFNYQSKTGGYVYDYVVSKIHSNGTAFITASDLVAPDPNSAEPFYTETFECQLGKSIIFYANELDETQTYTNYNDVMTAAHGGNLLRVVLEGSSVGSLSIDTYEDFNDPENFGPPEFSWGTTNIARNAEKNLWVLRSSILRMFSNASIETGDIQVTTVDLMPDTLEPVEGVKPSIANFHLGKSAKFIATDGAETSSIEMLRFRGYITGHFDNRRQIRKEEEQDGKATHPYAEHVSDIANQKIENLPKGFSDNGQFFLLEETYYTMEKGADPQSKPMLYLFCPDRAGRVKITSYTIPADIPLQDIKNSNPKLRFDYTKLEVSPTFTPATYEYSTETQDFSLGPAVTPLDNGGQFILTETISSLNLKVMEDVIVDGKSVMPYDTPIVYERI